MNHTKIHRRAAILAGASSLLAPSVLRAADPAPREVIVATDAGRLRGSSAAGVNTFKGVPYGAGVSGANRFKPAKPAAAWTGVRDALALGAPSLQDPSTVYGRNEPAPAEDCLFLNIWAPATGGRGKPVMFYSHGGGFTTGSAGSTSQDGANLAREQDVVVVASNHRLGLLGYLYLGELGGAEYAGSGNQGLSDIVLALSWVRRNIAAFGGDPDNITIFGESGGGAKTTCLYSAPSVAPMFSKAIVQSGPARRVGRPEVAAETTRMFLQELGLAPTEWRKLLVVPAPELLAAQNRLAKRAKGGEPGFGPGGYGPILDPALLPRDPFDPSAPPSARDKPLMVGWLDREAAFFSWINKDVAAFRLTEGELQRRAEQAFGADAPRVLAAYRSDLPNASPSDLYMAVGSAMIFGIGSQAMAERKAAQGGAPVYYYNLAYRSNRKVEGTDIEVGAMHAIDIPLVFNNVADPDTLAGSREDRFAAARNASAFWGSFARSGAPAAPGQPAWAPYTLADRATMVIDTQCRLVRDRWPAARQLWQSPNAPKLPL